MATDYKIRKEIKNIGGHIKEVISVYDSEGKVIKRTIIPLKEEFYPQDVLQVMIGAAILAIPVGFTEETWRLGETLPLNNVIMLMMLSIAFIAFFSYYHYYRDSFKEHRNEFFKRVVFTYLVAIIVVALLLNLIQKTPWMADWQLAFKRVVLVAFPASMSGAIADTIK
jgi:uncharacterized membrane protein